MAAVRAAPVLGSKFTGLSKHLKATLYAVDARGSRLPNTASVVAPVSEGTVELTANWQSPFELAGAEARAPAITGMLQSGALESYVAPFLGKDDDQSFRARLAREISEFGREGQGRSGMTKLNSTQVFTGAAPIKIPLTLHFRAFDNPRAEVREPIDQLARWTLARSLAKDGSIVSAIKAFSEGQGFLKALLPSESPTMVGLVFDGYTFAPLVIESMARSVTAPKSSAGEPLHVAVQIVLASLTALDAGDWTRARQGKSIQLFNT
ncbi:hypothetical protein IP87_15635 [beta proteobacterium AAP121]|nr:hypothetical protein IP80_15015 [beta proteobacterium AAP65]KPF95809.1 hypothetical protein IP87_15635 [beta proteobacterium AAP121]